MIDRKQLLSDLQALLKTLEADLLERSESAEVPDVGRKLREEYDRGPGCQSDRSELRGVALRRDHPGGRCLGAELRLRAGSWKTTSLSRLRRSLAPARGSSGRGTSTSCTFARTRRSPTATICSRVFDELTKHAATKEVFGEHNPIRDLPNWLSGDAARDLDRLLPEDRPEHGCARPRLHRPGAGTRGSWAISTRTCPKAARKKYALLQTPVFVEEFILDRTLDPAIEEFGLAKMGYETRLDARRAGCIPTTASR